MNEKLKFVFEQAIIAQDACNIAGVIAAMSNASKVLWNELREFNVRAENRNCKRSAYWVNQHPVMRLYSVKLMMLSYGVSYVGDAIADNIEFETAYRAVSNALEENQLSFVEVTFVEEL